MNCRAFNKVVLQSLRRSQYRYLSVQHNINKCSSSTCQTVNFHKRKESHSSSFIFTKLPNNRTLCQSSSPVYTHLLRNFSGTSQLNGPDKDPLKDIATTLPPPEPTLAKYDVADNTLGEYAQQLLVQMHEATGLPWWASIALTAWLVRTTILLPWAITQLRVVNKLEKVDIDIQEIDKQFKRETIKAQKVYGWPEHLANQKYEEAKDEAWWKLVGKENCHPMKSYFLISLQMITWLAMSCAVYSLGDPNAVGLTIPKQMATSGYGWFTDLTASDPYFILPLALGLTNLLITEIHHSFVVLRKTKKEQYKNLFFRAVSIATIPLAAYAPASVNVYWLSSSLYGLVQALLINSSPVRRVFRVPINDPGLKQPYRYLLNTTKERLKLSPGTKSTKAIAPK